ncbi:hypothetical protein RJ639_016066 [Escallonia herrerae]|uniref:Reverse transcriptase RNase H-like domain-containing protein n=1 Tax=Escallonia herrerae TaxID=1293975 RepID=A0AA89AKC2_9ASTE|nr:hypothetical protein RJ639_016066 [Escallonia herrerae]
MWEWSKRCHTTFEGLKEAMTEEPVLVLPNHAKVFEVQTNASDFAIEEVLMQERHPIAFESRKLNDTERKYTVQEKEMIAVIHCLCTWRHYLLGSRFLIKTDNIATSYFQSQKKLSPKQARWQDFLAEFDYSVIKVQSTAVDTHELTSDTNINQSFRSLRDIWRRESNPTTEAMFEFCDPTNPQMHVMKEQLNK